MNTKDFLRFTVACAVSGIATLTILFGWQSGLIFVLASLARYLMINKMTARAHEIWNRAALWQEGGGMK